MTDEADGAKTAPWFVRLVIGLILDVGIWLGMYYLVLALTGNVIGALIAAGSVALVRACYVGIRRRTVDPFLAVVVLSFLVSVLLALLTADPRVLLWKGAMMTAVWGVAALFTLRWGRPILFSITQRLVAPGQAGYREWSRLWATSTPFRWLYRRLTLVWGVSFIALAALQAGVILTIPVDVAAPLRATVSQVVYIGLVVWTIVYSRYAERSLDRPLDDAEAQAASSGDDLRQPQRPPDAP